MGEVLAFPLRGTKHAIRVWCCSCKTGYVVEPAIKVEKSPYPREVQQFYGSDVEFCRHCGSDNTTLCSNEDARASEVR